MREGESDGADGQIYGKEEIDHLLCIARNAEVAAE